MFEILKKLKEVVGNFKLIWEEIDMKQYKSQVHDSKWVIIQIKSFVASKNFMKKVLKDLMYRS